MAASDPVPGVPTPTGTLQGAAAFSWDGATWQPAGRAYSSVATPTGVLRGVAPFTFSAGNWTPTGKATPGVPTPTGTLDGVAVYTWSGSAWTPAGGAPDVPTPSGTLQGVAAFNWDGTAWQPTGQAAAEVPTPSGVLQGVAMFSWSGTGWAPTVSGVAVDINFVNTATLDARVTFTRASTATYFDSTGTMQTAATNAPRFDYDPATRVSRGLLIEEQRTNVLLQSNDFTNAAWSKTGFGSSSAPVVTANQTTAPDGTATADRIAFSAVPGGSGCVVQQTYTGTVNVFALSVWLKGSVGGEVIYLSTTPDGATYYHAAITLTTSWQRITVTTATLTAGTWYYQFGTDQRDTVFQQPTSAQTIYAWGAQIEQGAFPTSYIPTTGAAATRAADVATLASGAWRHSSAETVAAEFMLPTGQHPNCAIVADNATTHAMVMVPTGLQAASADGVATITTANALTIGAIAKAASTWVSPNAGSICLNGGAVASAATQTTGFAAVTTFKFMGDSSGTTDTANGYIRRFRYWPSVLTNAQLQQVTT